MKLVTENLGCRGSSILNRTRFPITCDESVFRVTQLHVQYINAWGFPRKRLKKDAELTLTIRNMSDDVWVELMYTDAVMGAVCV